MTLYILATYLVTIALGFIVGIHTGRASTWDAHVESALEQARQRHPSGRAR